MMGSKRRLVIIGVVVLVVILLFSWLIFSRIHNPSRSTRKTDKDTGEVIISEPNRTPETAGGNQVILLGTEPLLDNGLTQGQFAAVKQALSDYSQYTLHNSYDRLKILTDGFTKVDNNNIAGKLRLGDSNNIMSFTLNFTDVKYIRLKISDPSGKNGGDFDSGLRSQPSAPSTDEPTESPDDFQKLQ